MKGILMLGYNTKLGIRKSSRVTLGDRLVSDGRLVIMVDQDAQLKIGDRVYFNENAMLSCKSSIEIGSGCRFGPNVKVFDNNHKFSAESGVSSEYTALPVFIGKNCWLGANVVILKGTHIGKNCVIGAGCIVSGDIPDASIVTMGRDLHIKPIE